MLERPTVILGCRGQVGYELVRSWDPRKRLIAFDRQSLPLDDADALVAMVREFQPEVVVNAAAYTAVDRAESEPDLARQLNALAPAVLADACREVGTRLVHFSTDYVFGDTITDRPYTESDTSSPLGVYGHTKLEGERAVLAASPRNLVLRISWIYGARGRNFLITMRRLQSESKPLRVVDDQVGAPTWCREVASATNEAVRQMAEDEPGGLYHLGSGGQTSWYGFAEAIFEELGLSASLTAIPTSHFPTPARRPHNSRLDSSAFCSRFGFSLPDWRDQLGLVLES